ncbi:MAG: PD-(D/E)XK nuclease family protein [Chloroflexi bacterium]|nr:PD-(D/E)XK nuclease family protein [Chloroflexota bacterium]
MTNSDSASPRPANLRRIPLGAPLVDALRDEIASFRSISALEPITVLTPSRQSGYFLRQRLAGDGLFNVQFLRVEDLAETIAGSANTKRPLTRLRAAELVHGTAVDPANRLPPVLDRIRHQEGFQRALHRTLDDLDAASPTESDLHAAAGSGHYGAVAGLWRAFRARASELANRADVAREVADVLRSDPRILGRFGHVVFLLVEEPALQYTQLVRALTTIPDVSVLIGTTGEASSDALIERVIGRADHSDDGSSRNAPTSADTLLVSASDKAQEARWVVRDVLKAARDGTPFGRMAVLFDDRSYGARMTQALQASGIPVAGPAPITLAQTPHGRWYLGLLSAIESDLARDRLMAWITANDLKAPDGLPVSGPVWEAISRRAGLVGGAANWDGRLGGHAARLRARADNAHRLDEVDEARVTGWLSEANETDRLRGFVRRIVADAASLNPDAGWGDRVGFLNDIASRYRFTEPDAIQHDDDDSSARKAVESTLQALADLDSIGASPPTLSRFRQSIEQEFERPAHMAERLGRGVFVSPLRNAVGCDFDVVYVMGMAEGSFPSIGSEDPLLPDSVRSRIEGMRTLADGRASARRWYLTALATAPRRVLTWPRSSPGAARRVWPARWFTEAAETLAGGPLKADLVEERDRRWLLHLPPSVSGVLSMEPADRHEYDVKSLTAWRSSGRDPADHYLLGGAGSGTKLAAELEQGRYFSHRFTNWDGAVGASPGWSPRSLEGVASPTRLETWATCPFRYFLSYELEVESTEAPEEAETISPLDRGTLIHNILEEFVDEAIRSPDVAPIQATQDARLAAIANAQMDDFERGGLVGRRVLWRLERERISRGLADFLDVHRERQASRGQIPVATELGFGDGEKTQAVSLSLGAGRTLSFRGRMDRVDMSQDGRRATVIDYKSGSKRSYEGIAKDPVDSGRHLQLPIYGMALRQSYPDLEEINAEFWFVMDSAGAGLVGGPIENAERRMREVVDGIAAGIDAGVFPAYPGEGSRPRPGGGFGADNCVYCPYDRLCPANRGWLWERKADDPTATPFTGLMAE